MIKKTCNNILLSLYLGKRCKINNNPDSFIDMETTLEKIQFRLEQSKEKLLLASIFLEKKKYCDSILSSYRAIFYAIRVLLVGNDIDSDDPDTIIEIFEKYLDSTVFRNAEIIEIAKRSKEIKNYVAHSNNQITHDNAETMLNNASTILHEVEKYYNHYNFNSH